MCRQGKPAKDHLSAWFKRTARGASFSDLAEAYGISRASVCRVISDAREAVSKGYAPTASIDADSKELRPPISAA